MHAVDLGVIPSFSVKWLAVLSLTILMGFGLSKEGISRQVSYTIAEIDSLNALDFTEVTKNLDTYEPIFLRVYQASDSLKYLLGKAESARMLGVILNYLGKEDLKVEYRLKSIENYEAIDSLKQAGYMYAELGWGFRRTDIDRSVIYMREGIRKLQNYPESIDLANAFNNYGLVKLNAGEPDSALYFIRKSLEKKEELKDTLGVAYSYSYLANVYNQTGEFQRAIEELERAVELREMINDTSGISIDYVNAGFAYQGLGELEEAKKLYKRSLALALITGNNRLAEYAYSTISSTFESMGMPDSALIYFKNFTQYKDSVLNFETNSRIAELEVQFRTEEKEKELAQTTAELAREQLRVRQRNLLSGVFALLFISISIISVLFVRQQKIKRRNLENENKLKLKLANAEMENKIHLERERISRDLHDNVGSQITNLITGLEISQLHFQKQEADKALGLLADLDADARGAMTELRETIWLMDKDEITTQTFTDHIRGYVRRQSRYLPTTKTNITSEGELTKILNPTESLNLMRIIQEALNNTRKYAQASTFEIHVQQAQGVLHITLADDGDGMMVDEQKTSGNGLRNMKERATLIGAELTIKSTLKKGTSIKISLPI